MAHNSNIRTHFIDYLRGIMIMLVVLDHSMHAYSSPFKKFWYLQDFGGNIIFDIWHMHNDAIMMVTLFFISGIFVIPSLKRHGIKKFVLNKFIRIILPFILGVIFIVPPQKYAKYLIKQNSQISYIDYLQNIYFFDDISASGFWFLAYLIFLTTVLVVIYYMTPSVLNIFAKFANYITNKPIYGMVLLIIIMFIISTVCDFIWGAHWWIGYAKIFCVRGSRFLMKAFVFFLGAGFSSIGLLSNTVIHKKLNDNWKKLLVLFVISITCYIGYSLHNFYDGAYNIEVKRHFYFGGKLIDLLPIIYNFSIPVIIRTMLLTCTICLGIAAYCAIFKRFFDCNNKILQSLAVCSYGIFIFHENITVWIQYILISYEIHLIIKFIFTALPSLFFTWYFVHQIRKAPVIRKVL